MLFAYAVELTVKEMIHLRSHATRVHAQKLVRDLAARGVVEIEKVDTAAINALVASWRAAGLAEATVSAKLWTLKRIFQVAQDAGAAVHYPKRAAKARRPREVTRWLTQEEEDRLKRHLLPSDYRLVRFLILTGLRGGEFFSAKRQDVDLNERSLWVPPQKTDRGRKIMLNGEAAGLAAELIQYAEDEGSAYLVNPSGFGNYESRQALRSKWLEKCFRPALRAAEIQNFTLHSFRHTTASRLVQAGASLFLVQNVLGHATPNMTQRYAHLSMDAMRATMDLLR